MYKFTVIKNDDLYKYTSTDEMKNFVNVMCVIEEGRMRDGKSISNEYAVLNLDEPYAQEVIEIMKRHGHWD